MLPNMITFNKWGHFFVSFTVALILVKVHVDVQSCETFKCAQLKFW